RARSFSSHSFSKAVPSISSGGMILSSNLGIHQVALPIKNIVAGTSDMRMKKASKNTETTSAKPKIWMNGNGWLMKATNTEIIMIEATVTTRAACVKPKMVDSSTPEYGDPGEG